MGLGELVVVALMNLRSTRPAGGNSGGRGGGIVLGVLQSHKILYKGELGQTRWWCATGHARVRENK